MKERSGTKLMLRVPLAFAKDRRPSMGLPETHAHDRLSTGEYQNSHLIYITYSTSAKWTFSFRNTLLPMTHTRMVTAQK